MKEPYNLKRRPGPIGDAQPATNVIQAGTPIEDNLLIRRLVGPGNISGFAWRGCLVLLYVLYGDDSRVDERAMDIWRNTLDAIPDSDHEQIARRLRDLAQVAC
jgi:hypothetical protein